jgi:signal transduction histidine kinase
VSLFSSLTNRIFFGSAILVTVAIGVAVYRVNKEFTAQTEQDLRAGVTEAAALVTDYVTARQTHYSTEAKLIVDLPVLTNAISTADPGPGQSAKDLQSAINTVHDVAAEYAALISPDVFVVLGRNGHVLARVGQLSPELVPTDAVLSARPSQADPTWLWPYPGGLLQVTALPTGGASPGIGTLVLGFSLNQRAVDNIKAQTKSDLALVADGKVLAATLDPALVGELAANATTRGTFDVALGEDEFIGLVQPLGPAGSTGGPVAIVLRDRTERLRVLRDIQRYVLVAGLVAVLVATVVGYAIARTVTRPVRAITATMGRMAATGDLTQPPPAEGRWDDEDARVLGSTFRQMTAALDRFRREAAQRERLSSLGRLSTVVAHEVRNPLMIIKSSVRSLRKEDSPEVGAIASSIDEEVSRINRVVTGVLDFARPIRFDLAPADLVQICRDAAQAVQAGAEDVPVAVDAAEDRAVVDTDAERVRTVLVNVLSNAQQAVRAKDPAAADRTICLRTRRAPSGWRIEVTDRGGGIPAEHLPRLFEPFFTTRRTGSGLGLALARNIVEGLGGTIAIESTPGTGTTVRIELPERATLRETTA